MKKFIALVILSVAVSVAATLLATWTSPRLAGVGRRHPEPPH
jgi:hypothetical protein